VDTQVTGSEGQFREFFAAEYGRLRGLGYLLTGDWAQAEELAQEALVRTYQVWPRVRRHDRPGACRPASGPCWSCATTRTCPRRRWPGEVGTGERTLKMINWCDRGPTRMRWVGDPASAPTVPINAPRCIDSSKPSRLSVERTSR
jgi:hypothetical protein